MQLRWPHVFAAALPVLAVSCGGGGGSLAGGHPSGTGPFDSRGNYVEAWADSPSQWKQGSTKPVSEPIPDRPPADVPVTPPVLASNTPPARTVVSQTTTTVVYRKPTAPTSASRPKPKPAVAKATPKPKPKVVAKRAPVKVKPKSTRHSVRSGENLYNIAKRYGTSVGAIQRANNIKGAMIRPGQSLVIPR